MRDLASKHMYSVSIGLCVVILIAKFFWSYVVFDVPLGYDVGLYRFLFLRHAEALPPFAIADISEWAKGHSLGLFFFSSILLKIGVPVDWLIGWVWNAMAVVLSVLLAWAASQSFIFAKAGKQNAFLLTLIITTLSLPLYDGFVAMYWKTYLSLAFVVATYALIDRKSYGAVITASLAIATHNQTGLLLLLAVFTWWAVQIPKKWKDPQWRKITGIGVITIVLGFLFYLPIYHEAVGKHLTTLLEGSSVATPEGAFPDALYYWKRYAIILVLGAVGFLYSLKHKEFTLWHTSVIWSAIFVFGKLFFYKRFFLDLDFFLLPFAALAFGLFWRSWKGKLSHGLLVVALCVQFVNLLQLMHERSPVIHEETYRAVQKLENELPSEALLISLENLSPFWLAGWLPHQEIVAPGFFDARYPKEIWDTFLFTDSIEREGLLRVRPEAVYFFLPREFFEIHQQVANVIAQDPCLELVSQELFLYRSLCSTNQ